MFQPADGVSNVLQAGYKLFEKVLVVLCDLDTYEELAITDKKGIHRRRACKMILRLPQPARVRRGDLHC